MRRVGEGNGKSCAVFWPAGHGNGPLVNFGDFLSDGQAQACAPHFVASGAGSIRFGAVEAIEQVGEMLGWDGLPAVVQRDGNLVCFLLSLNRDDTAWRRIFNGIVQQVEEEANEQIKMPLQL